MRLALPLLLCTQPALPAQSAEYLEDFDIAWEAIDQGYAYFAYGGEERAIDWIGARERLRPQAAAARDRLAFLTVLETLLEELRDHHVHVSTNGDASPRLVPRHTEAWAEWIDGQPVVTAVRPGSALLQQGLVPGAVIDTIRGSDPAALVRARLGLDAEVPLGSIDHESANWALRVELAGRWNQRPELTLASQPDRPLSWNPGQDLGSGLLRYESLSAGDSLSVGYIRIHNSLGNPDLVRAFDEAMAALQGSQGLILDLRWTPGGGNSWVARGILGHFVDRPRAYQRHTLVSEERATGIARSWIEEVSPRVAEPFQGPVAVLVGRWTTSMGEGLGLAFDQLGATVFGTPMAGHLGALHEVQLPHTGWKVRYAGEAMSHVDGTRREDWTPPRQLQAPHSWEVDDVLEWVLAQPR